jgi:hypothetical protein
MSEILIDGNNLAYQILDVDTISTDNDRALIAMLRDYQASEAALHGKAPRITIYFDAGAARDDLAGTGTLKVRVAPPGRRADGLIIQHLARAHHRGGSAAHISVVTDDRIVRSVARELGAKVLSCAQFGRLLREPRKVPVDEKTELAQMDLSDIEQIFLLREEQGKAKGRHRVRRPPRG